ncbi:hypothetical protein LSCM1_05940 [Leishmania martiniquensis]|uniref:Uncharacterized protein n=1 Tax=Leishmania martiniquensis TaxID=1580590 RepID=A0A836KV95_9TRYP|nr:hypothetical protein LSCM1_05940 [Leishmania martiniquensis]
MPGPKGNEVTLEGCDPNLGRSHYVLSEQGTLCVEPAAGQGRILFTVPTLKNWSRDFWYLWLIIFLIVVFGVAGCILQSFRWYHRLQHRHEREARSKRVDGMIRLMSSIYSRRSASASGQRSRSSSFCRSSKCSESLFMRDISDDDKY